MTARPRRQAVVALTHKLISAATPGGPALVTSVPPEELEHFANALCQASFDVAWMLLRIAADARGETPESLAGTLHAELLLLDASGELDTPPAELL